MIIYIQCWLAAYILHIVYIYPARYQVYISGVLCLHTLMSLPFDVIGPPAFLIIVDYIYRHMLSCRLLKCLDVLSIKHLLTYTRTSCNSHTPYNTRYPYYSGDITTPPCFIFLDLNSTAPCHACVRVTCSCRLLLVGALLELPCIYRTTNLLRKVFRTYRQHDRLSTYAKRSMTNEET